MTPLMKQYWDIKSAHKDKILLFRMGDFYEMFFEDAITASGILGITLTSRNKKAQDETPMCGVPHHSISGPINKLLTAGLKVAICDQIEDPKFAKGIVQRAVTRVLTPGMVYDSELLDKTKPHYIASFSASSSRRYTLAFVDVTTGEAFFYDNLIQEEALRVLTLLPVAEIVISSATLDSSLHDATARDPAAHDPAEQGASDQAERFEQSFFSKLKQSMNAWRPSIAIFDIDGAKEILSETDAKLNNQISVRRLRGYVSSLVVQQKIVLTPFEERHVEGRLELTYSAIKQLEIFENFDGAKQNSLFGAIDKTKTSGGARLLRSRLAFPWITQKTIENSFNAIEHWIKKSGDRQAISERLSLVGDTHRRLTRINGSQAGARDLLSLSHSMSATLGCLELASESKAKAAASRALESSPSEITSRNDGASHEMKDSARILNLLSEQLYLRLSKLSNKIASVFVEDPPISVNQGGMIQKGVSSQLDEYIDLTTHAHSRLFEMEAREKAKTGITTLKIRYNNVFGYYIEVTQSHLNKVPKDYVRKQTLANAERYVTQELMDLEQKILSAQTKRNDLENQIFNEIKQEVLGEAQSIIQIANLCSELDVEISLATIAVERKYVRPTFGEHLKLHSCRHPVVEQKVGKDFVSNDLKISEGEVLLLTGPNMAGKSTLMRQVALIAIMAQAGSFVPAIEAVIPIYDKIFTRIGANDNLSEGLSTFMVEMRETAEMLDRSTERSLVILDEIGRGTSTFDGLSLAQAILEELLMHPRKHILFATHYHELTKLENKFSKLKNGHMAIHEDKEDINFLYTLKSGPAEKSYGIQVALLAGVPKSVTLRATQILNSIGGVGAATRPAKSQDESMQAGAVRALVKEQASTQLSIF